MAREANAVLDRQYQIFRQRKDKSRESFHDASPILTEHGISVVNAGKSVIVVERVVFPIIIILSRSRKRHY